VTVADFDKSHITIKLVNSTSQDSTLSQYPVSFSSNIGSLADISVPRADKGSDIKKKSM
jgi:hypothetical protein